MSPTTCSWTPGHASISACATTPVGGANWVWRAGIDNVTDENYWSGASTSFANYLVQGEPRTFKLSATVEF
ncbi:TonB-dependent receptor (plasmid) [Halomonas sp. PA16-9]|nr:TonB-dependent receptor [Halomonas sp. PA16-9]